jgi:phytoene desaturase
MSEQKKAIIIGAGFGGLSLSILLARDGWDVTILEKNEQAGGRASLMEVTHGELSDNAADRDKVAFRFDMGPSWYLMPDVFDRFFESVGEKTSDYYDLVRLQPSYRVTFKDYDQQVDIYGNLTKDTKTFDAIEPGSGQKLRDYLKRSAYVYDVSVNKFLYRNYDSAKDFMSPALAREAHKLSLLSTMDKYVSKYFKDPRLQQIMQYPLVFLGSSPYNAPALYNLMSHVDFNQGVFYPQGGLYKVTEALVNIAEKNGVKIMLNSPADKITVENGHAVGVKTKGKTFAADAVISNADPHHTESKLLEKPHRDHSEKYWKSRTLAPSALLMYLGVDKQYKSLQHHNLLFSKNWKANFDQIFDNPTFPDDPSLYVCAPSKTDPSVAPKGKENLFVLVPIAAGLEYTEQELQIYADKILSTMEKEMKLPGLRKNIIYKKLFCVKDFESRFNSLQGTGLGLAHTLKQTAIFRPSNKSKKVSGLYYVGANVHPGIGLPVCLISAELVRRRLN